MTTMHSKSFSNKSWWVKLILYSHALDSFGEEFCKAYVGGVAPALTFLYLFLRFHTMAKNATICNTHALGFSHDILARF
jgi:hypothetical protein